MKFLHTSDLHIGKRLHEQPLIGEQREMLARLVRVASENSVSGVFIAGDIYDRGVPSLDAVDAFDNFITELANLDITIFIIAGNHDSADRLDFGARIMSKQKVFISGSALECVTMTDEHGEVNIWMLPYMRSQEAEEKLCAAEIDEKARNIILAHQFVTSGGSEPTPGGSEVKIVGGIDAIDVKCFDRFDYAALGHIHRPQCVSRETVRYSGSSYRYSFAECDHVKQSVIVNIGAKGKIDLDYAVLSPGRDLYRIRCKLSELADHTEPRDAYVEVTLTDDVPIVDAITKVRNFYPNTLQLYVENKYTGNTGPGHTLTGSEIKAKTPVELFQGFFEEMTGTPISRSQRKIIDEAIEDSGDETC